MPLEERQAPLAHPQRLDQSVACSVHLSRFPFPVSRRIGEPTPSDKLPDATPLHILVPRATGGSHDPTYAPFPRGFSTPSFHASFPRLFFTPSCLASFPRLFFTPSCLASFPRLFFTPHFHVFCG